MPNHLSVVPDSDPGSEDGELDEALAAARMQSDLGRQKSARALLRVAGADHPRYPALERLLAVIELRDGRPLAALAALDRADGAPDDVTTLRVRATALTQLGRAAEALVAARAALAHQRDVGTLTVLGMAELVAGTGAARETAEEAVRSFPAAAAAHRLACLVALHDQRWEAAEQAGRAASHCPGGESTETLNNLALALLGQGRLPEARGMMRAAWVASEVTEHAPAVLANRRQLDGSRSGSLSGLRAAAGSGQSAVLVVILCVVVFGLAIRQLALPVLALILVIGLRVQLRRRRAHRRPYSAVPAWSGVTVKAPEPT